MSDESERQRAYFAKCAGIQERLYALGGDIMTAGIPTLREARAICEALETISHAIPTERGYHPRIEIIIRSV